MCCRGGGGGGGGEVFTNSEIVFKKLATICNLLARLIRRKPTQPNTRQELIMSIRIRP